jgi:hypothetical protein
MRKTKGYALCSGVLTFVVSLLLASFGAQVEAEPSRLFGVQLSENYEVYDIDPTTVVEDGYGLDPFYRVDVVPPEQNPGFEYYTITFDSRTKKVEEVEAEHPFGDEQSCREAADDLSKVLIPKFEKEPQKWDGVNGQYRQYEYNYIHDTWAGSVRCITFSGIDTWLYISISTNRLWEARIKNLDRF